MSCEQKPYEILNEGSDYPILLMAEHAGKVFPEAYGMLGLAPELLEQERNLPFDFGAAEVVRRMAEKTGATALLGTFSRLIVDLNRDETSPELITTKAHGFPIPLNADISEQERASRIARYFTPFHERAEREIARLRARHPALAVFSIHTYTPAVGLAHAGDPSAKAPDIGVLYQDESALLASVQTVLSHAPNVAAAPNFPYDLRNFPTSSIHRHGVNRGLPTVGVEISIARLHGPADYDFWSEVLAQAMQDYVRAV